jgi:hypothetical protein
MKLIAILLFISVSSVYAQEADVAKAVEALKQAMIDGKREGLEKITHSNLSYGHSSGLVEDKAAFIEKLASGADDITKMTVSDQAIKVTGDVATVRQKLVIDVVSSGKPNQLNLSVLLIFVKDKGEWKLLARQSTKV